MDNLSRRHSNEDTTTSMYLSFDAESTMSTACYRTLEAMDDISVLSAIDMNESVDQKNGDDQMNSTLELLENSANKSHLKTVKKIEVQGAKSNTPLKVLSKNILKEYKALCSTPAREQLLKTVDVTRGSDASRCVDLGVAFLGVDDERPAYFPITSVGLHHAENKENLIPDCEEVSTLSTCSSVEITTSVIEKKMLSSMTTVDSVNEEKPGEDMKFIKDLEKGKSVDMVDRTYKTEDEAASLATFNKENFGTCGGVKIDDKFIGSAEDPLKMQEEVTTSVKFGEKETSECTKAPEINLETKTENTNYVDEIGESSETHKNDNQMKEKEIKEEHINKNSPKTKIGVLTGKLRRSVCEPNLQTNRPSRILSSDRRRSFLPTCKKTTLSIDTESEIPLLMSRMLKITNTPMEGENDGIRKEKGNAEYSETTDKRRNVMPLIKTRTSLLPSAPGSKRPFSFNHRMSVVVKTTLNSPARKIARKSSISGAIAISRKSTVSQKTTPNDILKVKNADILTRKSMVPKPGICVAQSNKKISDSVQKWEKPSNSSVQKKSLYVSASTQEANVNSNMSHNKPTMSYTCNICQEKFRIKSLLDAHKRTHESESRLPAFIRKPLTITHPISGTSNSNQCKYCDKKFALLKALHIHLLQNCSKIPPSEKRKLEYTDLNHVEKAQLPVFSHNSLQSSSTSSVSSANDTPQYTLKQCVTTSESLSESRDIQKLSNLKRTVNETNGMASQNKKINAHTGVYRTPSKSVPCHLCKLTFRSILDYTNHNLTTHATSYKASTTDSVKAVKKNNA